MSRQRIIFGLLAVAFLVGSGIPVLASKDSPRQYYGPWVKHAKHNYHYRTYFHKPHNDFVGYKHHYVIHHAGRPDHHFFFNPYKKQYWGRCPVKTNGKPAYSLLAEADRKATLEEIPEKAFPAPGALPKIPDATDDALLDLPPDDLPTGEGLPIAK